MYILLATPLSMNGVHSQLFTLLYATSQTTYDLQLMPFWKLVNDSSTHCKKKTKIIIFTTKKNKNKLLNHHRIISVIFTPHIHISTLSPPKILSRNLNCASSPKTGDTFIHVGGGGQREPIIIFTCAKTDKLPARWRPKLT